MTTSPRAKDPHRLALAAILGGMCAVLLATAIPGTFSIDEANYIATVTSLRDGSLAVPASTGMPPSPELLAFDAAPRGRLVTATPVVSSAPPMYAPFGLLFSPLGARGLILLAILAFAVCAALVFTFVRRVTTRVDLAWLALATFVLGCFALDYAQGIWPHTLAMALVMGAIELVSRVRAGSSPWLAAGAGACVCLAAGIRYQNIVSVGLVGAGVLWVARPRLATALLAFALGCAPVLATTSVMNHVRYDSWNPISKGAGYLALGAVEETSVASEAVISTWARVVDYTAWPAPAPGSDLAKWMPKDPRSGAFVITGAVKKSLLQSAPWTMLPLLAVALALLRRSAFPSGERRELLALGLLVAGVLGMFALYGFRRYDAWCFNQRYFLELMPALACAASIALGSTVPQLPRRMLGIGAGVVGVLGAVLLAAPTGGGGREIALMKIPLLVSLVLAVLWALQRRNRVSTAALGLALGGALGWAVVMHVGDDVPASRSVRAGNAARLSAVAAAIPAEQPAALIAYWGNKDAFGLLPLTHDVLVIDPWIDDGQSFEAVVHAAMVAGRTVYATAPLPRVLQQRLAAHYRAIPVEGVRGLLRLQP